MNFTTNTYTPGAETVKQRACASSPTNKVQSNGLTKKVNNKPVLFPQLQEASLSVNDKDWRNLLLRASRGEFLNKFIYYDGVYMCKKDTGVRELMPKDSTMLAKKFISFHKRYEGITSSNDIRKQDKIRNDIACQEVNLSWDICHAEMKQSRLIEFAHRTCKTYESAVDMIAVLRAADSCKLLTKYTVTMDNNKISNVSCITYNKQTRRWYIN